MKLVLFAACEKVLIESGSQKASLIGIIQRIAVQRIADPAAPLTSDAIIPQEWAVFSLWNTDPEDVGKQLVQHTEISWPDKTEFLKAETAFTVQSTMNQQNYVTMRGFPIGQIGEVAVAIRLEENGSRYSGEHLFTIRVEHQLENLSPPTALSA